MRVMFTVWPLSAHLYPMLPLAWALQGAGHEVCVASHPDLVEAIIAAGLTAVALGEEGTIPALSSVPAYMLDDEERSRLAEAANIGPVDQETWDMFSRYTLASVRIFHEVGAAPEQRHPGVDDLVDFARDWRPDLVLWDVCWPASAVAARLSGAAHARLLWGPDYSAWAMERFANGPGVQEDPLVELVRPVAERYGLKLDDELLLGQWTVDPTPVALRLPVRTRTVSVRRVPYNGAGLVPKWLYPQPQRPRVAVSLGVSGRAFNARNEKLISTILEMVGGMDIDVVATLNVMELAGQQMPDNVQTIDYMPLSQLLPTCAAVIHHGGGGTLTAAVAQKVPQLIVESEGLESGAYAKYLTSHGAGLILNYVEQSVEEMRRQLDRVLTEPSFQDGTGAIYADWLTLPSPNDVVPVLEKLTAQHRAGPAGDVARRRTEVVE